ncbi:hypothetical protein ACIQUU_32115 [Streptomyces sp. NPDC101116]|uniref:hypothetical protein n=1 Tax=Streptomyces sp. NPDC101116 TaxID=3366107 RepID=UPI00380D300B
MSEPNLDEYDDEKPLAEQAADFDAFFGEEVNRRERPTLTVCGKTYTLPDSLPLMFTLQAERVQESSSVDDVRKMLAPLFGADALDHWADNGMTDRQFRIVLVYATANVRTPGSLTMQAAAELHDRQEAEKAAGKAPSPNRAARRSKTKKRGSSGKQ